MHNFSEYFSTKTVAVWSAVEGHCVWITDIIQLPQCAESAMSGLQTIRVGNVDMI